MKAEFLNREINTVSMTMDVTAEEFEECINNVYNKTKSRFNVPGFRRGKAPRRIIENNYGADVFTEPAVEEVFNKFYGDALDELGYVPVDHPDIDLEGQEIKSGQGIHFKVKFLTEPEVEVSNYKGIKVEVPTTEVSETEIEDQLKSYADRNARLITVDRASNMGDTIVFDYQGFTEDGVQFEGGTAENYKLEIGSGKFVPGFEEQLVRVHAGDEKDVEVTFPENYPAEKLAGHFVTFKCKIHEVMEKELPPIDDDLAKECSEYDTLEEWKVEIRETLEKNKKNREKNNVKNEVLNKLYESTVIDIPEIMIENQIDELTRNFDQQLGYSGMNIQEYLKSTMTTLEEFREQIRYEAEKGVKTRLIVESIARQEGIDATEDELTEELGRMGIQYGVDAEKMRELVGQDLSLIKKKIAANKAAEMLAENAEVEYFTQDQNILDKAEEELMKRNS
jgi:trigger factor